MTKPACSVSGVKAFAAALTAVLASGLTLAFGLVLALNFLNAFAFTYPYSIPQMRAMGWLVYAAAAVAITCASIGVDAGDLDLPVPLDRTAYRRALEVLVDRGLIKDGRLTLPPGYYWEWSGQFENQVRATKRMQVLVPITLGIMFVMLYLGFARWWIAPVASSACSGSRPRTR